ncbi:hypothetical protein ACQPXS_06295 [Streptomyces sp. CA-142005]|uniref:hypothetical protein n=1 Tax=Streptomyces sp. CA-142005 TaxID=3240052 RepID=UPI003D931137
MAGRPDGAPPFQQPYGGDGAWAQELLDQLRPAGRDLRRLADWLARTVSAAVSLQDDRGVLLAGERLPLDPAVVADVATGRASAASLDDGARMCGWSDTASGARPGAASRPRGGPPRALRAAHHRDPRPHRRRTGTPA